MKRKSIEVAGATSIHEGEFDKPNEDFWQLKKDLGIVALADGVTRNRANGMYPKYGSTTIPMDFVLTVLKALSYVRPRTAQDVKIAVAKANEVIAGHNTKRGITAKTVDYGVKDYFATTGLVLCIEENYAIFGFIGDVIALHIPRNGKPVLLTRDQLYACHQFSYPHFASLVAENQLAEKIAKVQRQLFQRKEVRNKIDAIDPSGNKIGFGALTGEDAALNFVEIKEVKIQQGDRFLLASDALRVLAIHDDKDETIASYELVLQAMNSTSVEKTPAALINLIREYEVAKSIRSDDATVVLVEVN